MQLNGKFEYLGINKFQGKKDPTKEFYSVNLLQGSEVTKVFLSDGQAVLFEGLEKMDEVECELKINIGMKTYVSVVSVVPLENGQPVITPKKASA